MLVVNCLVFVHDDCSNSPIYTAHESASVPYFTWNALRTAQMQVPECRHEPVHVDSTDTNIVVTLSCLETTQQKKKKKR